MLSEEKVIELIESVFPVEDGQRPKLGVSDDGRVRASIIYRKQPLRLFGNYHGNWYYLSDEQFVEWLKEERLLLDTYVERIETLVGAGHGELARQRVFNVSKSDLLDAWRGIDRTQKALALAIKNYEQLKHKVDTLTP